MNKSILQLFILTAIALGGCNNNSSDSQIDNELKSITTKLNLLGDPTIGRSLPNIKEDVAQLGRKLFFSKTLSGKKDVACATCHHPILGGGDALPLSIGVGAIEEDVLGPSRKHTDGDFNVPRNAPSTFNIALYDAVEFWDGRVESLGKTPLMNGDDNLGIRTPDSQFLIADPLAGFNLTQAQARFPVTSDQEMRSDFIPNADHEELREALADRVRNSFEWKEEFRKAFNSETVNYDLIAFAIGEYERSQVFTDTPWKDYLDGDNAAISDSAKKGALLFFKDRLSGGADCASCHKGDFFTDEKFWGLAVPQVGRGKGDGDGTEDFGRYRETGNLADKYTFRTPSLINVEHTGPYMHSGAYVSLIDAVKHHLNPGKAISEFSPQSVFPANTEKWQINTLKILAFLSTSEKSIATLNEPIELNDDQIASIIDFLKSLTDPCVTDNSCLEKWIADEHDNPDGNVLIMSNRN